MKSISLIPITMVMMLLINSKSFSQTWIQKQDFPDTISATNGISFTINNKIYVGAGYASKLFKEYDPVTDTWTPKADIPGVVTERELAIGFSIGGKGYIGLGIDVSTPKNDLWEYDPTSDTWTQKQNFPGQASDGLYCFVINNLAYIGAGEDTSSTQYNTCYSYNPISDSWTALANFPASGRVWPFSFSIGNKGYVSSGAQGTTPVNLTYEYNPTSDTWTAKANYTGAARLGGVSFVLNNIAYCGLGIGQVAFYNNFYSYNPVTDAWTPAVSLPSPGQAFSVAAVANNSAYVGLGYYFTSTLHYPLGWWQFTAASVINELNTENSISIFPNPAYQNININFASNQKSSFKIINALGETIKSGVLSNNRNNIIDISDFSNGIYSIVIFNYNSIQSKPFIKN
jgi:N-acetylneuraminic acid mutarotase